MSLTRCLPGLTQTPRCVEAGICSCEPMTRTERWAYRVTMTLAVWAVLTLAFAAFVAVGLTASLCWRALLWGWRLGTGLL